MALIPYVSGWTAYTDASARGKRLSYGLKFLVDTLLNQDNALNDWTAIESCYNNGGLAVASGNNWTNVDYIQDNCWITLQNKSGFYVVINLYTWLVSGGTCYWNLGFSPNLPTGGTTSAAPTNSNMVWARADGSPVANSTAVTYGTSGDNQLSFVVWADGNSFYWTSIHYTASHEHGAAAWFTKLTSTDTADLSGYDVGAYGSMESATNVMTTANAYNLTQAGLHISASLTSTGVRAVSRMAIPLHYSGTSTQVMANSSSTVLSTIGTDDMEWPVQIYAYATSGITLKYRKGIMPDIRWKKAGVADGTVSADLTRVTWGDFSMPWANGYTWP